MERSGWLSSLERQSTSDWIEYWEGRVIPKWASDIIDRNGEELQYTYEQIKALEDKYG